jgi:hypothetical protein
MEGEAVRDAGWPDTGKSDLHKGRTVRDRFPSSRISGMRAPPESEDHLPHSWDVSRTSTECGPPLAHYRAHTQMSLQRTGECSNLETDEG